MEDLGHWHHTRNMCRIECLLMLNIFTLKKEHIRYGEEKPLFITLDVIVLQWSTRRSEHWPYIFSVCIELFVFGRKWAKDPETSEKETTKTYVTKAWINWKFKTSHVCKDNVCNTMYTDIRRYITYNMKLYASEKLKFKQLYYLTQLGKVIKICALKQSLSRPYVIISKCAINCSL